MSNFQTQGWVDTAFYTINWEGTYTQFIINNVLGSIWVFPKCFHWIQQIQWQKYLSL